MVPISILVTLRNNSVVNDFHVRLAAVIFSIIIVIYQGVVTLNVVYFMITIYKAAFNNVQTVAC